MPLSGQAFLSRVPLEIYAHHRCRMPRDTHFDGPVPENRRHRDNRHDAKELAALLQA